MFPIGSDSIQPSLMEFSKFLARLLPAAIAFGAAWAGAYFAFRFQNQIEEERKTNSDIDVINITMITLAQIHK